MLVKNGANDKRHKRLDHFSNNSLPASTMTTRSNKNSTAISWSQCRHRHWHSP
jgi:hypothetical protein